jgi:uncharacterized protein YbaP (TraB family)
MSNKINLFVILLLFSGLVNSTLLAQNKYPSLLWEISGKNLEKPSYLYGTMHVSSKLAFHLTDDFFESIENVDIVALESDPRFWLKETEEFEDAPIISTYQFYQQFTDKYLDKYNLAVQLASDHAMINGLLYRSTSAMQDFQEDTYLDMFIFQAGSRFDKEIIGLEDFKESRNLVKKAFQETIEREEKPIWLDDLLTEKNYDVIIRDAYRNNNLDMIDSLNNGFSTNHYLEHMLFKRNDNMIAVYDSIINTGKTIFAGVGAAHLPGEKGMIEGFRKLGYTVKPIKGLWTEKGKKAKKRINEKRKPRTFSKYVSSDGFMEFMTPTTVHEISFYNKTMYLAPDLTNGSYIAVSRMKLNEFVNKDNQDVLDFESIDKILIEYIPGKIVSKKKIARNGINGLDIKTKTKAGDHHRYHIFKTAMEFIIIKMVGKGEYVLKESDQVFDNIVFNYSNNWRNIQPEQGGFSISVPGYYFLDNNDDFTVKTGNPYLQAFDTKSNGFFFLKQKVLNDALFIEKDDFELKRIQAVYFEELDIDDFKITLKNSNNETYALGEGKGKNGQTIYLKTLIKGAHYYLLGSVNTEKEARDKFFDSFQYKPMNYGSETKIIKDTNLFYTVKTYKKAIDKTNDYQYSKSKKKANEIDVKKQVFNSVSKQQVFLKYHKYNHFDQSSHIDSIWNDIIQHKIKLTQVIEDTLTGNLVNGDPFLNIITSDTASDRRIRFKYIIHGGVQYKLSTVLDKEELYSDVFVNSIFESFLPNDTIVGISPMDPKATAFFEALYSENDSLVDMALKNHRNVLFFNEDKPKLIETIENYKFADENILVKKSLITSFCKLNSKDKSDYLIKWYSSFEDNADLQIHILKQFSNEGNKDSYRTIGKLLESDIPLPYKEYKIIDLFNSLNKNPELEEEILDDILGLLSIAEYQKSVLKTLSNLYDEGVFEKRKLKKFKKQLIAMAKVELKRSRSAQIANTKSLYSKSKYDELNYLINLLFPFRKENEVKDFYKKIENSSFNEQKIELLVKTIKAKDEYDESELFDFAKDIKTRSVLYKKLKKQDLISKFPESFHSLESLSESVVYQKFIKERDDSFEVYKSETFEREGEVYNLFVYTLKTKNYSGEIKTDLVYTIYKKDVWGEEIEIKNEGLFKEGNSKEKIKNIKDKFILSDHPRVAISDKKRYGW